MSCDASTLVQSAACFQCIPKAARPAAWMYLLCAWMQDEAPECGDLSNTIVLVGAGTAGVNQNYTADFPGAPFTSWTSADQNYSIEYFNGFMVLADVNQILYQCALHDFPCGPWIPVGGSAPGPTGSFFNETISWSPDTAGGLWNDIHPFANLADFRLVNPALVTKLDLSFALSGIAVTSITGLGSLANLAHLVAENASLTSINLSGFSSIVGINFRNNPLSSLNVSGCASLSSLLIASCQLSSIDLTSCVSLSQLDITLNPIVGTLDVSSSPSIATIDCDTLIGMTTLNIGSSSLISQVSANQAALTQASVDDILHRLVLFSLGNAGVVDLSAGTSSPPSPAGLADAATLAGAGWAVSTN